MKIFINRITNKISGAEMYILNQLEELRKYKDIEILFSSNQKEFISRVRDLDIKTIQIKNTIPEIATKRQLLKAIPKLPSYFKKYNMLFKQQKDIDVFIFHSMTEKIFLTPMLAMKKKKVIWVEHGPIFSAKWFSLIKNWYRLVSKSVVKIITVSEDTKKDLVHHGIDEKKIITIPSGIDTKKFFPPIHVQKQTAKRRIGLENKFVVGYVGTITKEKGLEEILSVAKIFLDKDSEVSFLLVGDGPDLAWCKDMVTHDKLSNVHFAGSQANIKQFYSSMDVFLFPTHHLEGISLALVEAAAMGLPIIASDKGGNREIITPVTGILYKKFSLPQCVGVLQRIKLDSKYFSEITKNARDLVEKKYAIAITTKTFYNLLQQI